MNVATMVFAVAIGLGLAPAAMGGAVNDTASTPGRTAPPGARTPPVALVGGTVHTVSGPTIPNGTVVIENGRIAAVGAGLAAPAGATIVSCAGRDVYPGMISPNTLLRLIEVNSVEGTLDYEETGPINPDVRAATAINPESELLPVTRANGVTTALVSPRGGLISGIAALIHLDGWTAADMT